MDKPFDMNEVNEAVFQIDVFQIDDSSSPRPNGFISKKFKIHWDHLKDDILQVMKDIQSSGKIIREINHIFICQIPKKMRSTDPLKLHANTIM